MRLEGLFSSIVPPYLLYTEHEALIVVFDNGIDPDPLFSGPVVGKLMLNEFRELTLSIQPVSTETGQKGSTRKEILFQGGAELSFFTGTGWVADWSKKNKQLPLMIRLRLANRENLAFFLPVYEPMATYR